MPVCLSNTSGQENTWDDVRSEELYPAGDIDP